MVKTLYAKFVTSPDDTFTIASLKDTSIDNINNQIPIVVIIMSDLINIGSSPKKISEPVKEEIKNHKNFISSVSFVKGVLLSGVYASISETSPVNIILTDEVVMPNFHKANLKRCFVIADAKGNLASGRVNMILTTLSCNKTDGTALERKIHGYVFGENGMDGLQGRVVRKNGCMPVVEINAGRAVDLMFSERVNLE